MRRLLALCLFLNTCVSGHPNRHDTITPVHDSQAEPGLDIHASDNGLESISLDSFVSDYQMQNDAEKGHWIWEDVDAGPPALEIFEVTPNHGSAKAATTVSVTGGGFVKTAKDD